MILIRSIGRWASTEARSYNLRNQENLIVIKDSCLKKLKQILTKPQEELLRIHVETGGCSGFSYVFQIENTNKLNLDEDLVIERDSYKIVINKEIVPFIKGSSIEHNESLIKSSFQITNPLAETKCGCGTSFSVNLGKLQEQKSE